MDCKNKKQTFSNSNTIMTSCHKGGIKIRNTNNDYKSNPFAKLKNYKKKIIPINDKGIILYDKLDLNIENYSREDVFNLFSIETNTLTEEIMKNSKKTVLKIHPDKSKLDQKYFFFFSAAYKKLFSIYEFQQKTSRDTKEEYNTNNDIVLDTIFAVGETNNNKNSKEFNKWFNEQFKKNQLEDPLENGYGDWLKSDEDIVFIPHVTKSNMAEEIEKRKKHVQTLTTYTGVGEQFAPVFAGSTIIEYNDNYTSGGIFSNEGMGYTDLRQAYVESVIPVTEEDYHKIPKFSSVDEYKRFREKAL